MHIKINIEGNSEDENQASVKVYSKWYFVNRLFFQQLKGCVLGMLLHPISFPRLFVARYRYFSKRYFRPIASLHGFNLDTSQEFLSYWEMFICRALHGNWMKVVKNRAHPFVVDVGANRGVFVRLIKSLNDSATVHAFEPQDMGNDIRDAGGIYHPCGLSNVHDIVDMHVTGECAHIGTHFGRDFTSKIRVGIRPLDSFEFMTVDVLKIDADGHLLQVLDGAKETLKKTKIVIVEVDTTEDLSMLGDRLKDFPIVEKLDSINYAFSKVQYVS